MGMGTKFLKLMGMGREWEQLRREWQRLLLMCSHLVLIFPPKSVFHLVDLLFYMVFCPFYYYLVILVNASQFFFRFKFKSNINNNVKNLLIFTV